MHISLIQRAAIICALAHGYSATNAVHAQEWTSLKVGELTSFSFNHAHQPDGRFLFGTVGQVFIQDTFGAPETTPLMNTGAVLLDPSFIAPRSATQALVGAGGFSGPSGVHLFNPSAPGTTLEATPLAVLQNYAGAFWKHPTSGREGWLVYGANGPGGSSNLTFISTDGGKVGAITGNISRFSAGLAVTESGEVFVSRANFADATEEGQIIRFTADQMDAAVLGVLSDAAAALALADAAVVFQGDASGSLAVDAAGRLWIGGFQIEHLQAYDPATGVTRRFLPDHPALAGASGPPTYAPKAFTRDGEHYVSFLANDGYYATGSDLVIGYRKVSELDVRSVQISTLSQTVSESAGSVVIHVTMTPAPTQQVTVPLSFSGTATQGMDYTVSAGPLVFESGEASKTLTVNVTDDSIRNEANETLIVRLGQPTPTSEAGLGALSSEVFTLTITDNDVPAQILANQNFDAVRVGQSFQHSVMTSGGVATRWSAKGLPPGLKIDPATGIISGIPTVSGEYDQIVLTATNAFGVTQSKGFILRVGSFPEGAVGTFAGLIDRIGSATGGLGARVTLVTTRSAKFTGKVQIGKKSYPIKGNLDSANPNPTGSANLTHASTALTLTWALDPVTGKMTGSLTGGATLSGILAQTSTDKMGLFNFYAAEAGTPDAAVPQGASFGSIKLSAKAIATLAGKAADGSTITSSSPLGLGGELVLYQPLYTTLGSFLGELNLANDLAHSVSGTLSWSKPRQSKGSLYVSGWDTPLTLTARGGKYRPVVGATLPLDAVPSLTADNARLVLQDGGIEAFGSLTNPQLFPFRLISATKLSIAKPQKISLKNATGAFTASITLGVGTGKRVATIQGLLIPDVSTEDAFDTAGYGFFLLPTTTAGVTRAGAALIEVLP